MDGLTETLKPFTCSHSLVSVLFMARCGLLPSVTLLLSTSVCSLVLNPEFSGVGMVLLTASHLKDLGMVTSTLYRALWTADWKCCVHPLKVLQMARTILLVAFCQPVQKDCIQATRASILSLKFNMSQCAGCRVMGLGILLFLLQSVHL